MAAVAPSDAVGTSPSASETRIFDAKPERVAVAIADWIEEIRAQYAFATGLQPEAKGALPLTIDELSDHEVRISLSVLAGVGP